MNTANETHTQATSHTPRVLEVSEVAVEFKISRTQQYHLRKSGALPFRQHPGSSRVFYLPEDIEYYFASIRRGGNKKAA